MKLSIREIRKLVSETLLIEMGEYSVNIREEPEFASIEDFVEFLEDDERDSFTHVELQKLANGTKKPWILVRDELEDWGLKLARRPISKRIRGFKANNHDRWTGPGSSKTHGGGGGDSLIGMHGRTGVSKKQRSAAIK